MRRLPGSHAPNCKNRSSKHLCMLLGQKPAIRSVNNNALQEMANNKCVEAMDELARRHRKSKKA